MNGIRIIIGGGRSFTDYPLMRKSFLEFIGENGINLQDIEVVSGEARGADKLGERLAEEFGLACRRFPADWNELGKKAGYMRNKKMVKYADGLLAFWNGDSKGTKYTIDLAREKGIIIKIVKFFN